jgi:glycosyltransferase involved in cell wall biosynthesis
VAKAVKATGINSSLLISVVSAVYNAEPWLEAYVREMHAFLAARFKDFEIVIVDNASTDGTVAVIERLQEELPNIQLYCLMRKLNQESAFVVGLEQAIGDVVVTIDANYDPPQAVDDLLERYYQDGVDIVYGVREHGDERPPRGAYYRLAKGFFKVYKAVTKNDLPVLASMFRLLSRRALNSFLDNRERYSLFRVMSAFAGLPYSDIRYQGINRSGTPLETSYAKATYRAGRILLLSSHEPLRFLSLLAVAGALFNVIYSIYVLAVNIFKADVAEGWTSLSLQSSSMFFLLFLILGVLSEYIGRLFIYSQNRPDYLIAREKRSLVLSRKQELNITAGDADAPSPSTPTSTPTSIKDTPTVSDTSTVETSATTSSATPSSTTENH